MIKISVIMPVYNETINELYESISSIRDQTYKNFEFIIIDDNPKSYRIKKYLRYEAHKDNRIKLIFNTHNIGSMNAANKGLRRAEGSFIARMDADDVARHNRLQIQLKFCLKYNLDFSSCNYTLFKGDRISKVLPYPSVDIINQKRVRKIMSYINIAIGPTLFFKRRILNNIGAYRNILCEDYDLASRSLINNYKMGYLSRSLIYKRDRKNNISRGNALSEFVICKIISKYLRKYDFSVVVPLNRINNKLNKLTSKDVNKYYKFNIYSLRYSKYHKLLDLIGKYYYAFSSILMCEWILFMHFSGQLQNHLLK